MRVFGEALEESWETENTTAPGFGRFSVPVTRGDVRICNHT
jgi:hypothetical protein